MSGKDLLSRDEQIRERPSLLAIHPLLPTRALGNCLRSKMLAKVKQIANGNRAATLYASMICAAIIGEMAPTRLKGSMKMAYARPRLLLGERLATSDEDGPIVLPPK